MGHRGGDLRSTGGVGPTPPPPRGRAGATRSVSPPLPPKKRAQRVGGKQSGQPRRPMQTLCDEHRALACKSCKGHRGVWHCCSRHHEGHPKVLGGQRCLLVQGGGCSNNWALCPSEGRCARRLPCPGEGAGSSRAGSSGAATRGHAGAVARPREGLRGGHMTRGGTSFRRAATHRGARGGIGQATGRL